MDLELSSIQRIALEFLGQYRKLLIAGGKRATGNLINNSQYLVEYDGKYLTVSLMLPEEWKYVEYGRAAGKKMPPRDAILKWIQVKPILPRSNNGRVPTENQLAFLIGRSIKEKGIPAGNYLQKAQSDFDIVGKVYDEIVSQVQNQVENEINS